ncbi:MAG: magnesium transporter CorA family protein [Vulcanimicrobiaceae bacterium]
MAVYDPIPTATRCTVFGADGNAAKLSDLSAISDVLAKPGTFVWIDLVDPPNGDLHTLQQELGLHPLAVEDAVKAHQRSKIDVYDGFWFIVVHAVGHAGQTGTPSEIAMFAGERFLITVRHAPAYPFDEVERRWKVLSGLRRDSGARVYTILDTIVDGYFPAVEAFEEGVEGLEDDLIEPGRRNARIQAVPREILTTKQKLQALRHIVAPMRDIIAHIGRSDVHIFSEDEMAYYRDVEDHVIRLIDRIDALRDAVATSLSIHLSVAANRQAEIARQLTIIATIFLPLSFITGFFGQNFGFLVNHIAGKPEFWLLGIGSEIVAIVLLFVFFVRKRWV